MTSPVTSERSMARSPSSTPLTGQHGNSPISLTPRSKVKAILAAIDADSDPEASPKMEKSIQRALPDGSENTKESEDKGNPEGDKPSSAESEDSSTAELEEDDEPILAPRGWMAARLNEHPQLREESSPSPERDTSNNAYMRVKTRLLPKPQEDVDASAPTLKIHNPDRREQSRTGSRNPQDLRKQHSDPPRSPSVLANRSPRSPYPGLFVTPEVTPASSRSLDNFSNKSGSDSELPMNIERNSRFQELVARKRAEREAKQAAEDQKRRERSAQQKEFDRELSQDGLLAMDLSDNDHFTDRRLTQHSRPTRKASKKALEEMNRETQRMSRNMQLAHQAKTKKKITKDSLFARFNFRMPGSAMNGDSQNLSSSTAPSSAPVSDVDEARDNHSIPTSPLNPDSQGIEFSLHRPDKGTIGNSADASLGDRERDLPNMLDIIDQPRNKSKGKGKAIDQVDPQEQQGSLKHRRTVFTQPPLKIRLPKNLSNDVDLDGESDIDILPDKKVHYSKPNVFNRLPTSRAQDGRSMQTLRALAHLSSPNRQTRGKKSGMSINDMQTTLQRRARQQAVEERKAKIEELRSRGIIVQSAEERQHDQAEVEDLLEKARREGEEIMQKEKRAANKAKIENGEVDDLPDSSDEDEEYQDGDADEPHVELSGSEEEDEEENDDAASDMEPDGGGPVGDDGPRRIGLVDDEASEDGDDEQDSEIETDNDNVPSAQVRRSRRKKMVIEDDDDNDSEQNPTKPIHDTGPIDGVPDFPAGPFDFGTAPMGMTQAFAATMADTQSQMGEDDPEQDSLALLDSVPEPIFLMYDVNESLDLVEDSQSGQQRSDTNTSKEINLHFSQSQIYYDTLGDCQGQEITPTQMSEIPDPTQDAGFSMSSPAPQRFVSEPPSTIDTVLLPVNANADSPIKKRGRLRRRSVMPQSSLEVDEDLAEPSHGKANTAATNAFDAMKEARRAAKAAAAREVFDKKKSEAKEVVEEQAQESEDEYAGLGGASDEDTGEEDADVNAMMDHGEVEVDERQLAQLYANKERASDRKAVEKLYKDINSGVLRRKRGADFDLSDSDDDAETRRRRKQREFAKMRKALLADENVGKIAEDPKKSAFLQTIEDRENDDDLDFLNRPAKESFRVDIGTQEEPDSPSQQPTLPPPPLPNRRKRPLQDCSIPDNAANMRPPASARRTAAPKKPASLAEIRESVSFLIEDPGSINNIAAEPSSSADEDEENRSSHQHHNPRRTASNPIIDRLSLKRAESTSASTSSSSSRLAFHDPATNPSSIGGFKVPSLLRRATTSQLNANAADANGISTHTTMTAATERAAGGGEKGDFVRRGGSKRSSINFVGRERERNDVVEGVERRRKEERERVARERRGSGLGGLAGGSFD